MKEINIMGRGLRALTWKSMFARGTPCSKLVPWSWESAALFASQGPGLM